MNQSNTKSTATPLSKTETTELNVISLSELMRRSYVLCRGCGAIDSRSEDDDHGQPAYCTGCGSFNLAYVPAAMPALIEPGDLDD